MKRVAAGVFIFTKDPHRGLVALIQKRGAFDYEKLGPEKYPGLFEVSAGGGMHQGEHLNIGIIREVEEELGADVAKLVSRYIDRLQQVGHYETPEKIVYTYAVYIPRFPLNLVRLHRGSAGFRLISEKELHEKAKPIPRDYDRMGPPPDEKHLWMFGDQLTGAQKGFQLFAHH